MPITEINQLPSRNNPETFAVDTEVTFDQLAQAIRDINDIGSIINTQITGTSTTSLTIGTGSKSLTVQPGLSLVPGYPVRIAYTTTPTDNMDGTVETYNSSTGALVVNVASVNGSGTYANWKVMVLPSATGNFADKSTANTFTDVQTFTGGVSANPLVRKQSDPTLGGALLLEKSSGSSLSGNLKFELSGNSLRIYENGGSNRGVTLDLTTLATSIADKILTTASLKNSTNDSTFASVSSTDAASPEWVKGLFQVGAPVTLNGSAAYDFSMPAGAKRLTILLDKASTNSTSPLLGQFGIPSIVTTGYESTGNNYNQSSGTSGLNTTAGFVMSSSTAADSITGEIVIRVLPGNNYVVTHNLKYSTGSVGQGAGSVTLASPATTFRLTTVSGTPLFDSPSGTATLIVEY